MLSEYSGLIKHPETLKVYTTLLFTVIGHYKK